MEDIRNGLAVQAPQAPEGLPWELFMYLGGAVLVIIGLSVGVIWAVLKFFPDSR